MRRNFRRVLMSDCRLYQLEDPDNGGTERVQLMSCWLDELTLQAFENGKITEDEFSGGFVGFKYLDTIADPCV